MFEHDRRRAGRGEKHVGSGQLRRQVCDADGPTVEASGQRPCGVPRAVGDDDVDRARPGDGRRHALGHLARTQQ